MDYPLESLGPERFQQLCQSLLAKEFPHVQCFPVAQPDGGRDAVTLWLPNEADKFMVFQVKYVRKPLAETEPHKWLTAIIDEEAPKVKSLIPRGAVRYVLITNIPGTAHPDTGSIDKLNAILSTKIGIPSICWWRDDLNRRLDNAWDLKWVYPEVMLRIVKSGVIPDDVIVVGSGLKSDRPADMIQNATWASPRDSVGLLEEDREHSYKIGFSFRSLLLGVAYYPNREYAYRISARSHVLLWSGPRRIIRHQDGVGEVPIAAKLPILEGFLGNVAVVSKTWWDLRQNLVNTRFVVPGKLY